MGKCYETCSSKESQQSPSQIIAIIALPMLGLAFPTALFISKCLPCWPSPKLRNKLKLVAHYNHMGRRLKMGPAPVGGGQMGILAGRAQGSGVLKSILGHCDVQSGPPHCTARPRALKPFGGWSHSQPDTASPVPASGAGQVLSPPMEASGMSLAALSLAPECPQAELFLPIQLTGPCSGLFLSS